MYMPHVMLELVDPDTVRYQLLGVSRRFILLDFDALGAGGDEGDAIIEPRQIFTTLVRSARFKFPSANQGEVLEKWFEKRNRADNTIKMNTGSGKMLVGLLALQSSLNEGVGPAVYVTPDNYLAKQVLEEARDLGIAATVDPDAPDFRSHKAILVANIDKLVNGKSVFGVGQQGIKIPIGSIVIDDAHACLEAVADQFSITLPSEHPAYTELLELFEDDLRLQSRLGLVEIKSNDPQTLMLVPFWAWQDKAERVLQILHRNRESKELRFSWPLLKTVMSWCSCCFSGRQLEIAPRCLPIEQIPSFARAKRRVYMTATLADDGILISHLGADPAAVADPIRPKGAGEIGDRMIIAPQEVNPEIYEADLKRLAVDVAKRHNVVVLVPSVRRAEFWTDVAQQTLSKENIAVGVAKLRGGHIGLTVLINRYDGVDLPDDACRLLIIDGLPESMGLLDSIESSILEGTKQQLLRQIQRLEQGMGRGVRSGEDRCAVLLFGRRLTQRVNEPEARSVFTPATLVQIDMGKEVTKQVKGRPIDELRPILDLCMDRSTPDGQKWWLAGRARLAKAKDGAISHVDGAVGALRKAFDLAVNQQALIAFETVQTAAQDEPDKAVRGYLMQQMAEYRHQSNAAEAQKILLTANGLNSQILRPLAGISYARLASPAKEQAEAAEAFMRERFLDPNQFVMWVYTVVADLMWDKNRTEQFESAMQDLGAMLGFGSQRPDKQYKNGGPDNLWAIGQLQFLVIECKSGVDNDGTPVSKDHCNQLLGAKSWFDLAYDKTCTGTPVLVHPQSRFHAEASPTDDMRVMAARGLNELRDAVHQYIKSIGEQARFPTVAEIQALLQQFRLSRMQFVAAFTEKPRLTAK